MTDRWHIPGPGESALDWFFGAGSRVLGLKSIDLTAAWAKGLPPRCRKCRGTGTIGKGLDLMECHTCRGRGWGYGYVDRYNLPGPPPEHPTGAAPRGDTDGYRESPWDYQRHPARCRFSTARCDVCRGSGKAWRAGAPADPCAACAGRGYVEALTADYSAMAREGALPDIDDAALHAYGRIARRLSAAGWRAEVVLALYHGDVGHRRGARVALMLKTAAGRKLVTAGRARSRRLREATLGRTKSGHLRYATEDSGLTDYDYLSDELARPENRPLKTKAEGEVDALLARAYADWNGAR